MLRRPGRPRREFEKLDETLAPFGGVMAFSRSLYGQGKTLAEVADALAATGGVRVTLQTVARWLREDEAQGAVA